MFGSSLLNKKYNGILNDLIRLSDISCTFNVSICTSDWLPPYLIVPYRTLPKIRTGAMSPNFNVTAYGKVVSGLYPIYEYLVSVKSTLIKVASKMLLNHLKLPLFCILLWTFDFYHFLLSPHVIRNNQFKKYLYYL